MAPGDARRDRYGRYLVVPPGGGKPVGYTRATTLAKVLDDQGGLMPWKAAMALTGVMRRPGHRATLEALMSQYPETGPWYGGREAKQAIKQLVEDCAAAGGSSDRADLGTALHAIIEQINLGGTPSITQAETKADVAAYLDTIRTAGIRFDTNYIECTYVLDEYRIAGTADMGRAHVPGIGHVIADLKTGTNLDFSWGSIAVQLAIYAHGDALYRQGLADDGSGDVRLPVPPVSQDVAVVIHLPAGEARCTLYKVDIAAGWEAFLQSVWVRAWRSRKDLATKLDVRTCTPDQAQLDELLAVARSLPAEQAQLVKDSWPAGAPPLSSPVGWTFELLEQVTALVTGAADSCVSPGVATATPASCRGEEEAATSGTAHPDVALQADPPGDTTTPMTVQQWETLTHDEQRRYITRGHLPVELRTPPAELEEYKARIAQLTDAQTDWLVAQARLIDLPNLGHAHRWTIENGQELAGLLAAAALLNDQGDIPEAVVHDWPALIATAGVSKAATLRKAKELGTVLDVKVGSKFETIPTSGPLADQLAQWLTAVGEQAA